VPLCFFVAAWTYALCVNFVPAYRIPADKFRTAKLGLQDPGVNDEEKNSSGDEMGEKPMVENHENVSNEEIKGL
jgi:FHS family L-fucose permease-like MFS transporter